LNEATYQTTAVRLCASLGAGLVAAFVICIPLMTAIVLPATEDQPSWPWNGTVEIVVLAMDCTGAMLIGFLLGVPVWTILHRSGLRRWHDAALVGFTSNFVMATAAAALSSRFTVFAPTLGIIAGVIGALVWLVAWRVSYHAEPVQPIYVSPSAEADGKPA
jgi:hypothetical protein